MRRKLIKIASIVLMLLMFLLALLAAWTWYQMRVGQSLAAGQVQMGDALGGLVIPETAVLYGFLSVFFLSLTILSIWLTYRLIMFLPKEDED